MRFSFLCLLVGRTGVNHEMSRPEEGRLRVSIYSTQQEQTVNQKAPSLFPCMKNTCAKDDALAQLPHENIQIK